MKSPFSESPSRTIAAAGVRTGVTAEDIRRSFRENIICGMGRLEATATKHRSLRRACAHAVRADRLFQRSVESMEHYGGAEARRVAYLSAEFLLGPHLANNLLNLGITEAARMRPCAASATTSTKSSRRKRNPVSAMAD